jgi:hypothetical protein
MFAVKEAAVPEIVRWTENLVGMRTAFDAGSSWSVRVCPLIRLLILNFQCRVSVFVPLFIQAESGRVIPSKYGADADRNQ